MSKDEELDREAESIYNAGSSWLSCLTELGREQGIEAMDQLLTEGDPYPIREHCCRARRFGGCVNTQEATP